MNLGLKVACALSVLCSSALYAGGGSSIGPASGPFVSLMKDPVVQATMHAVEQKYQADCQVLPADSSGDVVAKAANGYLTTSFQCRNATNGVEAGEKLDFTYLAPDDSGIVLGNIGFSYY